MRITVLTVPDCPNASAARERLRAALAGRAAEVVQVEVVQVEVRDEAEAARWGMTGSPTVLLDGNDPFARPGAAPSVSCRIYRHEDGAVDGAPAVAELRRALTAAGLPDAVSEDCCEEDLLDPVGRAGRGRRAPAERGLRAVHQAVLRHFAASGQAPPTAALETVAAEAGRSAAEVLAELAREDFLTLDEGGRIQAAYPFSATPTAHQVTLASGTRVWSMCAIDALGISAMLAEDAVITSSDPVSGEPVTVTGRGGRMRWEPASTVVIVARRSCSGPAATVCCDALNFFTSAASARSWLAQHPDVQGKMVDQARAEEIGRQTFGPVLAAG
ncbi:alkylmercury lyase family protein [Streptomyces sp. NBC_01381]|uniref:alkylmercury lyase family protein n=1 Tax=Streptomyces sp. NBC_01381 TaxID=2903845 RepID=UPI00225949D7|nr:alkylmercury lyase family protein [Streptomyces sp. NBC_01381]MCX4672667.1 alkylmercury lyase family protein [Streptomyces sp. NBC_01381]